MNKFINILIGLMILTAVALVVMFVSQLRIVLAESTIQFESDNTNKVNFATVVPLNTFREVKKEDICNIGFKDIKSKKNVLIPSWFVEALNRNNLNCNEKRWIVQIAWYESRFNLNAVGGSGEKGITQIMPSTWRAKWNPYRNGDMFNLDLQIKVAIIKYRHGDKNA